MKVKRYVASTVQEAINNIKLELGQDAVIMSTRKIRQKGWLGWFQKPLVEVVAAVDDVITTHHNSNTNKGFSEKIVLDELALNINKRDESLEVLERKVDAMGSMINKLIEGMHMEPAKDQPDFPAPCIPYYNLLVENEVEEELAKNLIKQAWVQKEKKSIDLAESIGEIILEHLGMPRPLETKFGKRSIALFLGPTGVGKTTTLAKLAAIYSIQHQKKVGLITADTYRIAAVDQLKIYAQILGIPLSIIYNPKELSEALNHHRDKDIILIDTAGKSIKNREQEKEIKELLSCGEIDEIYLVISSNTSYRSCVNVINSYKFLPDYKLLFTKTDEINSYGVLLNCCILSGKPLSYLTTGQDVPEDIEVADPVKIKDLLMGSLKT